MRSAWRAVKMARSRGIKAGLLKLNTIWPFPEEKIKEIAGNVDAIIVAEVNEGQVYHVVKEIVEGVTRVYSMTKMGGELHSAEEIFKFIESVS